MSAICDVDLATYCGRIGNLYVRRGLSTPFPLCDAARGWMARGIPLSHCVDVIERYLSRHAGSCYSGSGDWNFAWLSGLIERSWHDRAFVTRHHPARKHIDEHHKLGDYGADEQNRQAGRRTQYTSRLPNFHSRSAAGVLSRATRSKSALADQI